MNIQASGSLRAVALRVLALFRGSSPGASMVEYLIITGSCALMALLSFHNFGRSLNAHLDTEAEHIHGRGMPEAADLLDSIVDQPNPNCLVSPMSCLPDPETGTGGSGSGSRGDETAPGSGGGEGAGSGGSDSGTGGSDSGTGGSTGTEDGDPGSGTGGSGNTGNSEDGTDGTDEEDPAEEDDEADDEFADK